MTKERRYDSSVVIFNNNDFLIKNLNNWHYWQQKMRLVKHDYLIILRGFCQIHMKNANFIQILIIIIISQTLKTALAFHLKSAKSWISAFAGITKERWGVGWSRRETPPPLGHLPLIVHYNSVVTTLIYKFGYFQES